MYDLERAFESIYESIETGGGDLVKSSTYMAESQRFESLPSGPQQEYTLQKQIRPVFGKEGINSTPIGTHPDFLELEQGTSQTTYHYVCTLFVDIKGSTRLSLIYPLELVYKIKNAILQTCVEVVRSLDGHVHRLMGDAVMAFFGGSNTEKEDAIADAINCAMTLRTVLEGSIKPWMEKRGIDAKDFGFRIGCDFGDDHEVLWANFGYSTVGEVTATGLPVDMVSKLQGLASKNQTMLGQGIIDFINWPEKYAKIKKSYRTGEEKSLPVVIPNLTDKEGSPINYRMKLLNYKEFVKCSALPRDYKESIEGSDVVNRSGIDYSCFVNINGESKRYLSASRFLEKGIDLTFKVNVHTLAERFNYPLKVKFTKTNHGKEVPAEERDNEYPSIIKYINKPRKDKFSHQEEKVVGTYLHEYTAYRGLHTMKCEIFDSSERLIFRDWIGVMIK